MNFLQTLQEKPHRAFLSIVGFILIISGIMWRYDRMTNHSYSQQSDLEQSLRLIAGLLLVAVPWLLIYALAYWLLHKFQRPTHPKLNVCHFFLWIGSFVVEVIYSAQYLSSKGTFIRSSFMEVLLQILSFSLLVIFIVNVVLSLKKGKVESTETNLPEPPLEG